VEISHYHISGLFEIWFFAQEAPHLTSFIEKIAVTRHRMLV